jgi:hypothetical protein
MTRGYYCPMPNPRTTEFTDFDEWLPDLEADDPIYYARIEKAQKAASCSRWHEWELPAHEGLIAGVPTAIGHKHKRQVKGVIVYPSGVCDLATTVLLEYRTRLRKSSDSATKRLLDNSAVLDRILKKVEIMSQEEDEPDFLNKPSDFAYNKFREFVKSAYTHHVGQSPEPAIASDGNGGIVAEWKCGQNIVRLIVAPSETEKTYIYRKGHQESAIDHSPSGLLLAQRLTSIFGN